MFQLPLKICFSSGFIFILLASKRGWLNVGWMRRVIFEFNILWILKSWLLSQLQNTRMGLMGIKTDICAIICLIKALQKTEEELVCFIPSHVSDILQLIFMIQLYLPLILCSRVGVIRFHWKPSCSYVLFNCKGLH